MKLRLGSVKSIIHDHAVRHLVHLLAPLVLDEAHRRYQSGSLSFDDILVLTRRLLTFGDPDHDAIAEALKSHAGPEGVQLAGACWLVSAAQH